MSGSLLKDENYCLAAFFLQLYCLLRCSLLFRHSAPSDSLRAHGLQPARLPGLWDSPGKNTGVGCHFLLQGIFPTRAQTCVSCLEGGFFTTEPPGKPLYSVNSFKNTWICGLSYHRLLLLRFLRF